MKKTMAGFLAALLCVLLIGCNSGTEQKESTSAEQTKTETAATESSDTETKQTEQSAEQKTEELKAEIEYWSSWSETENQALALQEAAAEFMQRHPGVKINFTFNGRDNRNLVGSAIAAGTKVTAMDANADNIKAMWAEQIADLSAYFEQSYPELGGKKYIEAVMPSMTSLSAQLFDGKYSYFPYAPQAFMIFCNKAILEESGVDKYPATWEEFLAACERIKAAGYTPITSDANYITSWFGYYMSRLIGTEGVANLSKDPAAWKDAKVLEGAKAIEEMAKKGYFDPLIESNTYPNGQQSMVINGKIAMYINGTWLPNEVADTTPEDFKWGTFAFPTVPGGVDDQSAGCYSSYGLAINKDADEAEQKAAAAFGVYLTTEFSQKFSDMANAIPVSVDGVWPENLADAKEVLFNYTVRYPSQTSLTINSNSKQIIADACLKLMGGSITAEQFVEMAAKF